MGFQVKARLIKFCPMCGLCNPACHKETVTHFACSRCGADFEVNDYVKRTESKAKAEQRKIDAALAKQSV